MNREDYERDLKERQRQHLEQVFGNRDMNWRPCMHDQCGSCHGTGVKRDGSPCTHMIACPCPKCSPQCVYVPNLTFDVTAMREYVLDRGGW